MTFPRTLTLYKYIDYLTTGAFPLYTLTTGGYPLYTLTTGAFPLYGPLDGGGRARVYMMEIIFTTPRRKENDNVGNT